jgi:hypothetical protein
MMIILLQNQDVIIFTCSKEQLQLVVGALYLTLQIKNWTKKSQNVPV